MYQPGTILVLKEQRKPDPETKEAFPYNRVEVINQSPISHGNKGDWTGTDAYGVIVVPLTNFGATIDEPFGKLRSLYDVESTPVTEIVEQKVRIIDSSTSAAGPTPEEVFAAQAPGPRPEPGQIRARTPMSPLGEMSNPATKGPLD